MPCLPPKRPSLTAPKPAGFTLVELLVVIAIVAMLISILLPAIGKAKYNANLSLCAARLRQHGIGVVTYATDCRSWYPDRQPLQAQYGTYSDLRRGAEDFRKTIRPYMAVDKSFECPLSPVVASFEASTATYIWSGYAMWYGSAIRGPTIGVATPMSRTGDRIKFAGRSFNVLASDLDCDTLAYGPWILTSHPDGTHPMASFNDASNLQTQWIGQVTRGPVDNNVLYDDGSVKTRGRVAFRDFARAERVYWYASNAAQYYFFPTE